MPRYSRIPTARHARRENTRTESLTFEQDLTIGGPAGSVLSPPVALFTFTGKEIFGNQSSINNVSTDVARCQKVAQEFAMMRWKGFSVALVEADTVSTATAAAPAAGLYFSHRHRPRGRNAFFLANNQAEDYLLSNPAASGATAAAASNFWRSPNTLRKASGWKQYFKTKQPWVPTLNLAFVGAPNGSRLDARGANWFTSQGRNITGTSSGETWSDGNNAFAMLHNTKYFPAYSQFNGTYESRLASVSSAGLFPRNLYWAPEPAAVMGQETPNYFRHFKIVIRHYFKFRRMFSANLGQYILGDPDNNPNTLVFPAPWPTYMNTGSGLFIASLKLPGLTLTAPSGNLPAKHPVLPDLLCLLMKEGLEKTNQLTPDELRRLIMDLIQTFSRGIGQFGPVQTPELTTLMNNVVSNLSDIGASYVTPSCWKSITTPPSTSTPTDENLHGQKILDDVTHMFAQALDSLKDATAPTGSIFK